jgi:hypothetical protein
MFPNPDIENERLLLLADRLEHFDEQDAIKEFDMDIYYAPASPSCGTAGCALGLAATMPEFNALGLRVNENNEITYHPPYFVITYDHIDSRAGHEFFRLTVDQFNYIFMPHYYFTNFENDERISPQDVATRIRKFVADGGAI